MTDSSQLVHPPPSSATVKVTQLAYLEAYDAVIDDDYALAVYSETKTGAGQPVVKIKSRNTPGSTFDPHNDSFRKALRSAVAQGQEFLHWGFRFQSGEGDARMVESRVFGDERGQPTALEVHLVTRKADGSATEPKIARIDWPA